METGWDDNKEPTKQVGLGARRWILDKGNTAMDGGGSRELMQEVAIAGMQGN